MGERRGTPMPLATLLCFTAAAWTASAGIIHFVASTLPDHHADPKLLAFFLATAPALRPMSRRARVIFAIIAGVLAATFQLYVSVTFGPYFALLVATLLTPFLDRWFRPRALV